MPAQASASRHHRGHAHAKKAHGKKAHGKARKVRKVARFSRGTARHRARPFPAAVKAPVSASRPAAETSVVKNGDPKFGVFTDGSPYNGDVRSVDALQRQLDRQVDIVNWYQSWTPGSWVSEYHQDVVARRHRAPAARRC